MSNVSAYLTGIPWGACHMVSINPDQQLELVNQHKAVAKEMIFTFITYLHQQVTGRSHTDACQTVVFRTYENTERQELKLS